KAGVVWVNCTNVFDAAAGFGGYRESGFGREGGREGMYEYLKPSFVPGLPTYTGEELPPPAGADALDAGLTEDASAPGLPPIDRTPKLLIGGKQKRPDGNYVYPVVGPDGKRVGQAPLGNRKDVRDAVEAAEKNGAWTKNTAHGRAQVLYYLAENLSPRAPEFEERLRALTGADRKAAEREVHASISR